MRTHRSLAATVVALAAVLLVTPSAVHADRLVHKLRPVLFDSDPEVPDVVSPGHASRAASNRTVAAFENGARPERPNTVQAIRPEDWYRRILRILRALSLGGLVR
jgi:hypothetical protein